MVNKRLSLKYRWRAVVRPESYWWRWGTMDTSLSAAATVDAYNDDL